MLSEPRLQTIVNEIVGGCKRFKTYGGILLWVYTPEFICFSGHSKAIGSCRNERKSERTYGS